MTLMCASAFLNLLLTNRATHLGVRDPPYCHMSQTGELNGLTAQAASCTLQAGDSTSTWNPHKRKMSFPAVGMCFEIR